MVPFQLVIMISSPSARPYEHEPSPRPKQFLILRRKEVGRAGYLSLPFQVPREDGTNVEEQHS
jgi:hypothetical protein